MPQKSTFRVLDCNMAIGEPPLSEQFAKLLDGHAGVADDAAHRERLDRVVSGNDDLTNAVAHDDVLALTNDPKARFLQGADRVQVVHAR